MEQQSSKQQENKKQLKICKSCRNPFFAELPKLSKQYCDDCQPSNINGVMIHPKFPFIR